MSTVVTKNLQIGADGTASNNFTVYQPASPDGTLRIGNGNSGTTSAQVVLTSAGNVGIGTSSPQTTLHANSGAVNSAIVCESTDANSFITFLDDTTTGGAGAIAVGVGCLGDNLLFRAGTAERARIDDNGVFLVGKTAAASGATAGAEIQQSGTGYLTRSGGTVFIVNRLADDGTVIAIQQAGTTEGTIAVSGTTVSYNGGHLSRWAQTTTAKDESLVKGTVLSNLNEMNVYVDADGNPVDNEQLNKVKVSDVEGDANVAGVFVNWTHDDAHNVDEINMAMTGDMIIRIAEGVTVARGDLLMSAGDGTAKPQGDDIVRSKTIAKVTSTHVTCTYADGSFCVPCVLMAC